MLPTKDTHRWSYLQTLISIFSIFNQREAVPKYWIQINSDIYIITITYESSYTSHSLIRSHCSRQMQQFTFNIFFSHHLFMRNIMHRCSSHHLFMRNIMHRCFSLICLWEKSCTNLIPLGISCENISTFFHCTVYTLTQYRESTAAYVKNVLVYSDEVRYRSGCVISSESYPDNYKACLALHLWWRVGVPGNDRIRRGHVNLTKTLIAIP